MPLRGLHFPDDNLARPHPSRFAIYRFGSAQGSLFPAVEKEI
jgi:hypothetical protein